MPRRFPGSASASGNTVEANCTVDPGGNAWQDATASLQIRQSGAVSRVTIKGASRPEADIRTEVMQYASTSTNVLDRLSSSDSFKTFSARATRLTHAGFSPYMSKYYYSRLKNNFLV